MQILAQRELSRSLKVLIHFFFYFFTGTWNSVQENTQVIIVDALIFESEG